MNAAGTAYPPPDTATGTLNIIAASGAAPVTMQNNTWGNPSAFFARSADSLIGSNGGRGFGNRAHATSSGGRWALRGSKPASLAPAEGGYQ